MSIRPSPVAPEPVAGALLILIADDNPLMQELVSTILKGAGCKTELAENGQIALAKLEKADFDLIIMDNHMPVMTGVEAIKVIRSREDESGLSRFCLSRRTSLADRGRFVRRREPTCIWRSPSR